MKILELHYSTSWAGAERVVVDLSNELSHTNEVILCTILDDSLPGKSYYKKDLSGKLIFVCNDTDDDKPHLVEYPADYLLPKIHHAGYPVQIVEENQNGILKSA